MGSNTILSCTINSHLINSFSLQPRFLFLVYVYFWKFLKCIKITLFTLDVLILSVGVPLLQSSLRRCCSDSSLPDCCIDASYSLSSFRVLIPPDSGLMRCILGVFLQETLGNFCFTSFQNHPESNRLVAGFVWSCLNHVCIVVQRHRPNYKIELRLTTDQINKII